MAKEFCSIGCGDVKMAIKRINMADMLLWATAAPDAMLSEDDVITGCIQHAKRCRMNQCTDTHKHKHTTTKNNVQPHFTLWCVRTGVGQTQQIHMKMLQEIQNRKSLSVKNYESLQPNKSMNKCFTETEKKNNQDY